LLPSAALLIRLGHSPDPEDAFLYWGLAAGAVNTRGFEFEHVLRDIETLNRWALAGRLEVTAISPHHYPSVQERYVILSQGTSMESGHGPFVISRERLTLERLREVELAVPARLTTALLVLRLFLGGELRHRPMPIDSVIDEVRSGHVEAGIVADAGQLRDGLHDLRLVVDLGEWWLLETGLPMPLVVNVARRDLGVEPLRELAKVLADSISVRPEGRDMVFAHALKRRRGLAESRQDYGDEGRQAVRELLERGERAGAFDSVRVEFVA
jgi:1,4-dihydroxy-6-naphthoate synthase